MILDIVFGLYGVFGYVFALQMNSNLINAICIISIVAYGSMVLRRPGGVLHFYYVFQLLFVVISCFVVEMYQLYLSEIDVYGVLTGVTARISMLGIIFLVSTAMATRQLINRIVSDKVFLRLSMPSLYWLYGVAFVILVQSMFLIKDGAPVLMAVDRFDYMSNMSSPIYNIIFRNISFLCAIVALMSRDVIRLREMMVFICLVCLSILGGEKFSGLFDIFYFLLIIKFHNGNFRLNIRFLFCMLAVVVFILALLIYSYTYIYGDVNLLYERLALQGQMNFILDYQKDLLIDSTALRDYFGMGSSAENSGIKYLMLQVGDPVVVAARLQNDATFTAPFPGNIEFIFGDMLTPVACILLGCLAGFSLAVLKVALLDGSILRVLLALKFFILVFVIIMMGALNLLLDIKTWVEFLIVILFIYKGAGCRPATKIK